MKYAAVTEDAAEYCACVGIDSAGHRLESDGLSSRASAA